MVGEPFCRRDDAGAPTAFGRFGSDIRVSPLGSAGVSPAHRRPIHPATRLVPTYDITIRMIRRSRPVFTLLMLTLLSGCGGVSYYWQSARGHLSLMSRREPIADLLASGELSDKREQQLRQALEIRRFAVDQLRLPDNGSYKSFVELDRPFVVWNVVAAPRFSLTPMRWCFPVVGCVSYRGYYAEKDARAFAATLDPEKYDIMVGGSRAYSTLGWFDDPLTSPMVDRGKILLAEVIFHELAHQVLYFRNDTAFNEAFASTVGEQGVRRWLRQAFPDALPRYETWLRRKNQFTALLAKTAGELKTLYASKLDQDAMQARKDAIFATLRQRYERMRDKEWDGYRGYDGWFKEPPNNARLASIAVYRDRIPDFTRWLNACEGDFGRFYTVIESFEPLSREQRARRLSGAASCQTLRR